MKTGTNKWAAWSALVAAASLVVALFFNSCQVKSGVDAEHQAKLATELGLLTQLQEAMSQSVYSRVPYHRQFRELRAGRRGRLTPEAYRATVIEAANMDYFAWLFNSEHLTTEGADELWGPRMVCEYKLAFAPALRNPARDLPNLVEFIQERGRRLARLAGTC